MVWHQLPHPQNNTPSHKNTCPTLRRGISYVSVCWNLFGMGKYTIICRCTKIGICVSFLCSYLINRFQMFLLTCCTELELFVARFWGLRIMHLLAPYMVEHFVGVLFLFLTNDLMAFISFHIWFWAGKWLLQALFGFWSSSLFIVTLCDLWGICCLIMGSWKFQNFVISLTFFQTLG